MLALLARVRSAALTLVLAPLAAFAAPTYQVIGSIGISQVPGTPIVTAIDANTNRWQTDLKWTNNNAFVTNPLYFVLTGMWVNGQTVDANAMTWNDAQGRFEKADLIGTPDNEDTYLALSDTNINIAPGSIFGIGPGASLAAFAIGPLGIGALITTSVNLAMSSSVHTLWFTGRVVQQVPVPATLALSALALGLLVGVRRLQRGTAIAG